MQEAIRAQRALLASFTLNWKQPKTILQSWAKCIWLIQDTVSRYIFGYLYRISILFWEKYCICILSEISQKYLADTFSENWLKLCQLNPLILNECKLCSTDLEYRTSYQRSKGDLEVTLFKFKH